MPDSTGEMPKEVTLLTRKRRIRKNLALELGEAKSILSATPYKFFVLTSVRERIAC